MLSQTEERLKTFCEKITSSLTEEADVEVVPANAWAAEPESKPPKLFYRVADVAVIGEKILAVTGHEVAHLLWNVVEDARIERVFAKKFPGAESLFRELHADGPDGSGAAYTPSMLDRFADLPIKWRFIFNIDRLLHGNALLGSAEDQQDVESIRGCLEIAVSESTSQDCVDELEPAYLKMLDVLKRHAAEERKRKEEEQKLKDLLDQASKDAIARIQGNRPDMEDVQPRDDGDESDAAREGADVDDGQPGGKDHTPGMRQGGEGAESGAPGGDGDPSVGQSDPTGSGPGGDGAGGTQDVGGIAGEGSSDGGGEVEEDLPDYERVKPINVFEQMLDEEKGSNNSAVRAMQHRQKERAKLAKDVEKTIEVERQETADSVMDIYGKDRATKELREILERNAARYLHDAAVLQPQIRVMRAYARSVLQDNARLRYGGSYESGRRMKKTRLYRPAIDDYRVFEKRELVGGKSYAVSICVDQSGSMTSYGDMSQSKQQLAYEACLVFLEAFDGLTETSVVGFTDFPTGSKPKRDRYGYNRWRGQNFSSHRTYKSSTQPLGARRFVVPELATSYGSTPVGAGISTSTANLKGSDAQVRVMLLITDGYPSDAAAAKRAAEGARKHGIVILSLLVADYLGDDNNAVQFLSSISDRTQGIRRADEIPDAVYKLLRGVVKRGGYGVARV